MKIALLGGTGDIAEGLVLRWSKVGHEIFIGSRSDEKAKGIAAEYQAKLNELGVNSKIHGMANAEAAKEAEVIIISIPPEHAASTISQIGGSISNQIVVTPVVSMKREGKTFVFNPPAQAHPPSKSGKRSRKPQSSSRPIITFRPRSSAK